jgi:Uma2 family endonuclease
MSTARRLHYDYAEYLSALEMSELKLEYCDGNIYAMAGGTPAHAQLAAAVIVALHASLPEGCKVSTSDMKVRVEATDLSTFPDASVICGGLQTSKIDANAVVNPCILVEVTSKSTEDYDRSDKLSHYKQIPGLRAVLLISHRLRQVTSVQRASDDEGWTETEHRSGDRVVIPACDTLAAQVAFLVDAIYKGIDLG